MCSIFDKLDDDAIIAKIKQGDDAAMDYMLKKYGTLVKREIRTVYIIGAETEDLAQEGMIGLFKAIRDYDAGKDAKFFSFATLCVRRQIRTAITTSNRKKHKPLNTYISIYTEDNEYGATMLDDMEAERDGDNPEDVILKREQWITLADMINTKLSKFERQVISLYLEGMPYGDIATKLGKPTKSIDNALHRIRTKLSLTIS